MSSELSVRERFVRFYLGTARVLMPLDIALILWMTYLHLGTSAVRDPGALARAPNPLRVRLPALVLGVTLLWVMLVPFSLMFYDMLPSADRLRECLRDVLRWCRGYIQNMYRDLRAGVTGEDAE